MTVQTNSRIGIVALAVGLALTFASSAVAGEGIKPIANRTVYAPATATVITDGRSPDTVDAAEAAQAQVVDGRSPDTLDAGIVAHSVPLTPTDLRSPDTKDAAELAHSSGATVVVQTGPGSFDWTDAGIGAAGGFAIALILAGLLLLSRVGSKRRLAL
jgi:hypothetical protein